MEPLPSRPRQDFSMTGGGRWAAAGPADAASTPNTDRPRTLRFGEGIRYCPGQYWTATRHLFLLHCMSACCVATDRFGPMPDPACLCELA